MTNTITLDPDWLLALAVAMLAGLANSIYLTYHYYRVNILKPSFKSFCVISKAIDCDRVATSVGSKFIGIPVATLGMFAHWFLLFLMLSESFMELDIQEVLYSAIYLILLLMFLFSAYEAFISFVILKAVCIMCVALYLTIGFMVFAGKQALGMRHEEILDVILSVVLVSGSQEVISKTVVSMCLAAVSAGALAFAFDYGFQTHFRWLDKHANGSLLKW
jgi:uncharacterized membrane protein